MKIEKKLIVLCMITLAIGIATILPLVYLTYGKTTEEFTLIPDRAKVTIILYDETVFTGVSLVQQNLTAILPDGSPFEMRIAYSNSIDIILDNAPPITIILDNKDTVTQSVFSESQDVTVIFEETGAVVTGKTSRIVLFDDGLPDSQYYVMIPPEQIISGKQCELVSDALDGNTLSVYVYIVRAYGPVGVRDVTRGVELSSTSVAYHHLQKLENLGLIEKNSYGQYAIKQKASIDGHVWVGKSLTPQLMIYSFFFIGAFVVELSILLLSLFSKSFVIETSFWFLTIITIVAMFLFIKEGIGLYRKLNPRRTDKP